MVESLANWFQQTLGSVMPGELVIFITSMIPILELRGGLIVASAMGVPIWLAIPICIIGNLIPVILILLFITPLFNLMKKARFLRPLVEKLEKKGQGKNAKKIQKAEFWGLILFVGIPLPGTGGWTGALIASLLNVRFLKALVAIFLGLILATIIMSTISYGIPWIVSLFAG
ncbi:MAG: small multi-drug export protein [Oscillospiraceae bacterium]|nr:small multi-drug export protein [Oscillospiraceae bacterium]